jgi:hypothetical protein
MTAENGKLKNILSNPLLLLVVGGTISGLLIPYITTQWQNHQKELEIKTDLLRRISGSFAAASIARENVLIAAEQRPVPDVTNKDFVNQMRNWTISHHVTNKAFVNQMRNWTISSAVIGSELSAYFPQNDNQIGKDWDRFVMLINSFYEIPILDPRNRVSRIKTIQDIIPTDSKEAQLAISGLNDTSRYFNATRTMDLYVRDQEGKIIHDIISSPIPL